MKRIVTHFIAIVCLALGSTAAVGQNVNVFDGKLAPKFVRSVQHLGSPVGLSPLTTLYTSIFAYYDPDSTGLFGTYRLPDTIPIHVDSFQRFSFSERFTPTYKSKWYLDTAVVAFRAPSVTDKIVIYAVKPYQSPAPPTGTGYPYPFFTGLTNIPPLNLGGGRTSVFDSAVILADSIPEPDSVHIYVVAFHHKLLSGGSFYIAISSGCYSTNAIDVYGDQQTLGGSTTRPIDTGLDRSQWSAMELEDGSGTPHDSLYAGFMAGGFQDASQNILYPNLYIIAQLTATTASGVETQVLAPDQMALAQNFPNPVANYTTISYNLNDRNPVLLKVYNSLGEEVQTVVDEVQIAGAHTATIDMTKLPNGMYYYKLQAGDYHATRTMVVSK